MGERHARSNNPTSDHHNLLQPTPLLPRLKDSPAVEGCLLVMLCSAGLAPLTSLAILRDTSARKSALEALCLYV